MKTHAIILTIILTATIHGQVDTAKPAAPAASPAPSFESPGLVETKKFIPASLMTGSLHRVNSRAHNDSLVNTYFLQAEGTEFEVPTGLALAVRIREVYAIDALRKMKIGKEVVDGAVGEGERQIKSLTGIVFNPFGTIKNAPRGASRFFGRIGEGMKGGNTEGEGSVLQGISGVQTARVALAVKLGVSPYSYNQELQRQLTAHARAIAAGSLIVNAAEMPVGGPASAALTGIGVNETMQQTLATTDPNDLRIMSRKKLFALGVDRAQADEFLMHPWYSPWHEAIIADALTTIGVDPNAFLAQACKALTEEDAVYFQRIIQVLAAYQTKKTPLKSIDVNNGIVSAMDRDDKLVVPLSCDYAIWAEQSAGKLDEIGSLQKTRPEIKGIALWVDGKVSDRGRDQLKSRNIDFATGVLDKESSPAKTD